VVEKFPQVREELQVCLSVSTGMLVRRLVDAKQARRVARMTALVSRISHHCTISGHLSIEVKLLKWSQVYGKHSLPDLDQ